MSKIVVIGSSNTDLVVNTDRVPNAGETVLGDDFRINHGGKGANQAVAVARIGKEVSFVSKVGKDVFGEQMRRHFQEEGMDVSFVFTDADAPSGVALIIVEQNGENRIVVVAGANGNLRTADIDRAKVLIEQSDIVLLQLEIPFSTVEYVSRLAWGLGKKVILNPAPASELSDKMLETLYLITPNETEVEMITGIKVTDETSAEKAASSLARRGVPNVIITLGDKGAFVYNRECKTLVPAYKVKAVDTTAAGDVFNGALAVALAEGQSLVEAARFACAASAISVTRVGAQSSIPFRKEINCLLNN